MTTHFSGTKKKTSLEQENIDFLTSKKSLTINFYKQTLNDSQFFTRNSCLDLVTSGPRVEVNLFIIKEQVTSLCQMF